MRQFAEDEIWLPTGVAAGEKFQIDRNPFAGVLLDEFDSGRWIRFFVTGPQRSGKTLTCFIIPILFHLFEVGETVICGLPSMDMAADKWNVDLRPVIERTRYRDLMPDTGAGSKGGKIRRIHFKNGADLIFMSAGGSDKSRAGVDSRILVVTEVDGMDEIGGNSRETDKLSQMEGRVAGYGSRARIYGECTVSIEKGRTWQEYTNGTQSRLAIRCPHCRKFVTPEREQLVGWQDAPDIITAKEKAALCCPGCGTAWTEADRGEANRDVRLVHRGQNVQDDGEVVGEQPRTDTLGFRWTASNNLLLEIGEVAKREFRAARSGDEDKAEREMCQFVWALPTKEASVDLTQLDAVIVAKRTLEGYRRGVIPADTEVLTVGMDLGNWKGHWVAAAFRTGAAPHIVDYGIIEIPTADLGLDRALLVALRDFQDTVLAKGWDGHPTIKTAAISFYDGGSGHHSESVDTFCFAAGPTFWYSKGFGTTQLNSRRTAGGEVVRTNDESWFVKLKNFKKPIVEINVDHWKTWLHRRIQTPMDKPGAFSLFTSDKPNEHLTFAKHLTAEKQEEKFVPGKGNVSAWRVVSRNNHFGDATVLACVAANVLGVRLLNEKPKAESAQSDADDESKYFNPLNRRR